MKIKVGDQIFTEEHLMMVVLTDADKKNIANMEPDAFKYAQFPKNLDDQDFMRKWMSDFDLAATKQITTEITKTFLDNANMQKLLKLIKVMDEIEKLEEQPVELPHIKAVKPKKKAKRK